MNFKEIPKFVINLKRRPDRLESVQKEFDKTGLEVIRWPAIDANNLIVPSDSRKIKEYNAKGIYACMLSHYGLIKYAKENNFEYICVFEDDIQFSDDFDKRIEYCQSLDFDMLYLGGQFDNLGMDINNTNQKHIFQAINVGGTYAYIVRNTIYDPILDNMDYNWGADEFYANVIQSTYNCLLFYPFMVGHIDGNSDVAGHYSICPNVFKHYQQKKIL